MSQIPGLDIGDALSSIDSGQTSLLGGGHLLIRGNRVGELIDLSLSSGFGDSTVWGDGTGVPGMGSWSENKSPREIPWGPVLCGGSIVRADD